MLSHAPTAALDRSAHETTGGRPRGASVASLNRGASWALLGRGSLQGGGGSPRVACGKGSRSFYTFAFPRTT